MTALQRRILHLRQQARAEVLAAKLLVHGHTLDDVGGKTGATHQLRAGPASTNSVMSLSSQGRCLPADNGSGLSVPVFRHQRVAKIDGLTVHAAFLSVPPQARWLALPQSRCSDDRYARSPLQCDPLFHKQRRITLLPTPPGEPVMITSPGLKRVKVLMYSISSATLWIMLLVLSSCTMRPFSRYGSPACAGPGSHRPLPSTGQTRRSDASSYRQ